jgi:hypothetical protein
MCLQLRSLVVLPSRQPHIYSNFTVYRKCVNRLYMAWRYRPYRFWENKRSGRGRPISSVQLSACSPHKWKLEESLKKWKLFRLGKQEKGNKKSSEKSEEILDQQVSKPTRLKNIVIRHKMSPVHSGRSWDRIPVGGRDFPHPFRPTLESLQPPV